MRTNYFHYKKGKVFYEVEGSGPPLVMLHGWGGNTQSFYPLKELLKNKFTIYLLDFPGFGKSEEPMEIYDVSNYAELTLQALSEWKLSKPYVLSHSFGGRVIIKLASKHKDLFSKIILIGSAGIKPKKTLKYHILFVSAKAGKTIMALPGISRLKNLAKRVLYKIAGSRDYMKTSGIMRETFKKVIAEDLYPLLKNIQTSCLLIWGKYDSMTPLRDGKIMEREIPNAKLEIIHDGKHGIHKTHAKKIKDFILKFISI